ncbi:hypothetical protein BKI52_00235 [marine bacterium AO1-C]|nr:hypothetical protein BKI52_00235 [marine bacterium AO1-C]
MHLSAYCLYGQADFYFQQRKVRPGSKEHFTIYFTNGQDSTFLPITVFRGATDGPVLGITAGVHGYEYPPIIAGQRLIQAIKPQKLKGTIILVQVANAAGFSGRIPYLNPLDNKNLNRSFPGNKQGSITEKIAAFITNEVIGRADFFLDMHGGDAPEDLMSYAAYYDHQQKPAISEQGKKMAIALGFEHIVVFNTTSKKYMKASHPSLYCSAEAFKKGIPSIDIECGKLGAANELLIQKIVKSVLRLLNHLEMQKGEKPPNKNALIIKKRFYQSSEFAGIFYTDKPAGTYVHKGMEIGYITDFFGKRLKTVYAQQAGIILVILGTPPVNKGETIVVIGKVNE